MPKDRLFSNPDSEDDRIIEALHSREMELEGYETNIASFERQLSTEAMKTLPEEWPSNIGGLKGSPSHQLVERLAGADLELAVRLSHRDHLVMLLGTSRIECAKSQAAYDALRAHLPFDRLVSAVERKKTRDGL